MSKKSKKEIRREQLAREKRRRWLFIGVPIVLLLVVFIGAAVYRLAQPDLQGVLTFDNLLRNHDVEAEFITEGLPPTGGTHSPQWQNCGIYDQPLDNILAVHSLEHGAVWLAYHPDLAPEKVSELRDLVRGQSLILMSPFPDLASEVVMSSWGKQLQIEEAPSEEIAQFIDRYRGQGPEPGAPCTNGIGQPLE